MKKKTKTIIYGITSLLVAGALAAPILSALQPKFEFVEDPGEDTAIYDEDVVKYLDQPDYVSKNKSSTVTVNKVILHYYNEDALTNTRAFYIWNTGIDGVEYSDVLPADGDTIVTYSTDNTSMTITIDFVNDTRFEGFQELDSLMFIIKYKAISSSNQNWTGQSADTELSFASFPPDNSGTVEAWAVPSSGTNITIVDSEAKTKVPGVKTATFTDWKTISCTCSSGTSSVDWVLYAYDETYYKRDLSYRAGYQKYYAIKSGSSSETTFDITLTNEAHINMVYSIVSHDPATDTDPDMATLSKLATVTAENLYESTKFNTYYNYDGDDLGMTYSEESTTFKVWAPTAANMTLMLYDSDTSKAYGGFEDYSAYHMNYVSGGTWKLTVVGDLKGKYYNYQVDNSLGTNVTMDPYATTAGRSGVRGMVYDKDETNPDGWDDLPLKWDGNTTFKWDSTDTDEVTGLDISTPQSLTVYEVHVQDFTGDESWVSNEGNKRGTFNAFVESGTTLESDETVSTGYDHLNELGVDAVQIMPAFDSDNNENTSILSYNWGYNPLNYNIVEGGYSSFAGNGLLRVQEFKNLVLQMSKTRAHTRVIMDVVYNHVSSAAASCFNKLMPMYYFRYAEDGSLYNGSGCGNEIKTEAPMMRKYIVDSLCMWASEYKIKGFRFDLMGLIDITTLAAAQAALYEIDPDIYIYGEGWTGDGSGYSYDDGTIYPVHGATGEANYGGVTKAIYSKLYDATNKCWIGAFNDVGRNALRGDNNPGWGFMQKGGDASEDDRNDVCQMIWGANANMGANPKQTVNYASCHDNFTLRDQLYYTYCTFDSSGNVTAGPNPSSVIYGSITAHSLIFASNAMAFMLGGEELFRTKEISSDILDDVDQTSFVSINGHYISHNSYNSPLSVNAFDWNNKLSIEIDGTTIDVSGATDQFKAMIDLHHTMPKYDYDEVLTYQSTTSSGNSVSNLSWSGKKGSEEYYPGCAGFQFDEWFIYASGRVFGYVSAWDVPQWGDAQYSAGLGNAYDSTNHTVNLGIVSSDNDGYGIGCSIIIYFANGKRV